MGRRYEAFEVRAYGLLLADLVQRVDIGFAGMERALELQRELLAVVAQCCSAPPAARPTLDRKSVV